jgi:hypothetical protein
MSLRCTRGAASPSKFPPCITEDWNVIGERLTICLRYDLNHAGMSAKSIWDCRADCQRSAGLIGMPNYRGHLENLELLTIDNSQVIR